MFILYYFYLGIFCALTVSAVFFTIWIIAWMNQDLFIPTTEALVVSKNDRDFIVWEIM